MSRVFAYCRVSTGDQTTENQTREIAAAGFQVDPKRMIVETVSGASAIAQRPGFLKLMERMEAGDVLIVTKMDRLGRNAMDVQATVTRLTAADIRVHCLQLGGADLTSPAGKMIMAMLNTFAEFERDLLIERTQSGLARARKNGKTFGRPALLDGTQRSSVRADLDAGLTVAGTARRHGVSRQTVMRVRDAARGNAAA